MPNQPDNWTATSSVTTTVEQQAKTHTFTFYVLTFIFCLGLFAVACVVYGLGFGNGEYWPLLCLFAIPQLLQVIGSHFLYQKFNRDGSLGKFYRFYLFWMSVSLFSYTSLWFIYRFCVDVWWLSVVQYVPLLFVVLLGRPVWGITYAITESVDGISKIKTTLTQLAAGELPKTRWLRLKNWFLMKDMKESISNAPYWALLFFFTIYLVLAYIFSFAFAFHDKVELGNKRLPALFMSEAFDLEDRMGAQGGKGVQQPVSKPPENFRFYFQRNSPNLIMDDQGFRADGSKGSKDEIEKTHKMWRETKNDEQMKKLEKRIRETTDGNKSISIQIRGEADSEDAKTNFDLSHNRATSIYAEITKRFWADRTKRDINWQAIPVGSALAVTPPSTSVRPTRDPEVGKTFISDYDGLRIKYRKEMGPGRENGNKIVDSFYDVTIPNEERFSHKQVQDILDEVEEIVETLPKEQGEESNSTNSDTVSQEIPEEQKKKIEEERGKKIETVKEILNQAKYAGGRAGERGVFITLKQLEEIPSYQRFDLLDYVVYTIIGPDFGDFIPRTPYAKFLCAFANIVKLFFTIALFSAVLSLKRPNPPPTEEEPAPDPSGLPESQAPAVPATESLTPEKLPPDSYEPTFAYYPGSEREVLVDIHRPSGVAWRAIPEPGLVYKVNFPASQRANQNLALKVFVHAKADLEWKAFASPDDHWVICKSEPKDGGGEVSIDAKDENRQEESRIARVVIGSYVFVIEQKGITPSAPETETSGAVMLPKTKRSRTKKGIAPT